MLSSDALLESATTYVQDAAGTERSRYVILLRGENNTSQAFVLPPVRTGEIELDAIPPEVRQKVADNPKFQQTQIVPVRLHGRGGPGPGVGCRRSR